MRMKKYEITDIAHPDNPKLHRIRALTDVGTDVHKGDLGGFVETEDNLDQEGFAWIGKDAIACEDSYIGGDAILADSAVARDSAYVGNNAVIADHAVVQDNAIVCGGYISGNSCICGSAILNSDEQTRCAPMIGGNARVYGELTGNLEHISCRWEWDYLRESIREETPQPRQGKLSPDIASTLPKLWKKRLAWDAEQRTRLHHRGEER